MVNRSNPTNYLPGVPGIYQRFDEMSYQHIRLPDSGEKISLKDGRLNIPDQPIIGYVEGDGIGPDLSLIHISEPTRPY